MGSGPGDREKERPDAGAPDPLDLIEVAADGLEMATGVDLHPARFILAVQVLIALAIGIPVFVVKGAAYVALARLLGEPGGPLGAALGISWFGLFVAITGVALRAVLRRLPAPIGFRRGAPRGP